MVFTNRGREFCKLAQQLREQGYQGHLIAGGPFASFNFEHLLLDFPAFDSIGLGEGEEIICELAEHLDDLSQVPGICYRKPDGSVVINPSRGNPSNLDALAFPKRTTFHNYFDKSIASILTSRGCWRNCAFCSINAWYNKVGGKRFRIRSVENIVKEMKELYFIYGIRIFNLQDDNFFLENPAKTLRRFEKLRDKLQEKGIDEIAIAVKARPDSITRESIEVLDDLRLFRVFLGVENASENGLRNLNRKCTFDQILNSLEILNDFDIHIAYNLLMFEPETVMDDIKINLRFMERHIENPLNFCRAEVHAGTGLEKKLRAEGRLLGDYFGLDYRLKDPHSEAFHQISNLAFFDRNFSNFGLHYFNMQVDFTFQLLRRFYPEVLNQTLRGAVRNFIKQTNLDTYYHLCQIYDFVTEVDPNDKQMIRSFANEMRESVDRKSDELHIQGERILRWLDEAYEQYDSYKKMARLTSSVTGLPFLGCKPVSYRGLEYLERIEPAAGQDMWVNGNGLFGVLPVAIPYQKFKSSFAQLHKTQ